MAANASLATRSNSSSATICLAWSRMMPPIVSRKTSKGVSSGAKRRSVPSRLAVAFPNRAMAGLTAIPRFVQKTRNWLKSLPNSMFCSVWLAIVGM